MLVRTRIGAFTLADAVDPMTLSAVTIHGLIRPAAEAVAQLPRVSITAAQVADVTLGRSISVPDAPDGEVALLGPDGSLVAIAEANPRTGMVAPRRVLIGA